MSIKGLCYLLSATGFQQCQNLLCNQQYPNHGLCEQLAYSVDHHL